jgi:hypothetical protein
VLALDTIRLRVDLLLTLSVKGALAEASPLESRGLNSCLLAASKLWVQHQRQFQKTGKLSSNRKARLDALGFEWSPKTNRLKSTAI